jgi:hypothetical protein
MTRFYHEECISMTAKQRPEALAQFAETARTEKRKDRPGLVADQGTAPIPTDSKAKDEAATKVLQEGVTGRDQGAEEAVDRLPDRILESRHSSASVEQHDEAEQDRDASVSDSPYDATKDPRTGRPPSPVEAERLSTERELQRLRNAQLSEGDEEPPDSETSGAEIDVTLETNDDDSGGLP